MDYGKFGDLTGKKFGKLTVKSYECRGEYGHIMYKCECDCGENALTTASNLINGHAKSCGCFKRECLQNEDLFEGTKIANLTEKLSRNNTSGVKGVSLNKSTQKYEAYISVNRKKKGLGSFCNIEDAIKARKEAEEKYFVPIIERYKGIN